MLVITTIWLGPLSSRKLIKTYFYIIKGRLKKSEPNSLERDGNWIMQKLLNCFVEKIYLNLQLQENMMLILIFLT